ncbi:MAG: hypothetical protein AAFX00_05415 [Pseudomonadota bacterium]
MALKDARRLAHDLVQCVPGHLGEGVVAPDDFRPHGLVPRFGLRDENTVLGEIPEISDDVLEMHSGAGLLMLAHPAYAKAV